MRRLIVIAAGLLAFAATPAVAADPTVNLTHTIDIRTIGGGVVVTALCRAQADPADPVRQHAVDTKITCSVNGTEREQAALGGDSVVVVRVATVGPVTVCQSGEADFADVGIGDLVSAFAGPVCTTYPV